MKPPTKMVRTMLYTTFDVLQTEMYKLAYNAACDEWLKWHEELRRALGAQPGDDLIERANDLFEEADSMKKLAQNNMKTDGWKTTAESRGNLIEELLRKIAEKEDMLDTAAKLIKLQRDAMSLLLESVKTEKGEPNES